MTSSNNTWATADTDLFPQKFDRPSDMLFLLSPFIPSGMRYSVLHVSQSHLGSL